MGDFFSGGASQPTAKSYDSVHKEAIEALIKSLGSMYSADSAYTQLFNALNRQEQSKNLDAYNKDIWNTQLNAIDANRAYASALLQYQQAYGNQTLQSQLANLKASDPEFWSNYEAQGRQILSDLAKGSQLSNVQNRTVEQATRAGQVARGNMYGYASSAQEVYDKFMAGENLLLQRQQSAQNFLKGSPYNKWNIGAITAYTPQIATNGYTTLTPYAMANANNVAGNASTYEMNNYRAQNGWQMIENNQPSQFVGMLGGAVNGATTGFLIGNIPGAIIGGVSGGVMGAFAR